MTTSRSRTPALRPCPLRDDHALHRRGCCWTSTVRSGCRRPAGLRGLRRAGAVRDDGESPTTTDAEKSALVRAVARGGRRPGRDRGGRRHRRHPAHRRTGPGGRKGGRGRPVGGHAVLQQAPAGRASRHTSGRSRTPPDCRSRCTTSRAAPAPASSRRRCIRLAEHPQDRGGEGLRVRPPRHPEGAGRHGVGVLHGLRRVRARAVRDGRRRIHQHGRERGPALNFRAILDAFDGGRHPRVRPAPATRHRRSSS